MKSFIEIYNLLHQTNLVKLVIKVSTNTNYHSEFFVFYKLYIFFNFEN